MTAIIGSVCGDLNNYRKNNKNETPDRVKNLVKDLERKLPNLPEDKRTALVSRINAIKERAKAQSAGFRSNFVDTGINTGIFAGNVAGAAVGGVLAGPAGGIVGGALASSVGTYFTHEAGNQHRQIKEEVLGKAQKVGSRRRPPAKKKAKVKNSSVATAVAMAGISSAASAYSEIATMGWNWTKNAIFSLLP
ncbi:MAG: hypothetical protein WB791_08780 [Waddliaceae bacterium]